MEAEGRSTEATDVLDRLKRRLGKERAVYKKVGESAVASVLHKYECKGKAEGLHLAMALLDDEMRKMKERADDNTREKHACRNS